jgi:hypothetical protein
MFLSIWLKQRNHFIPSAKVTAPSIILDKYHNKQNNQTLWPLVRKRTIPTERPPLVDEILMPTFVGRGVSRGQRGGSLTVVNLFSRPEPLLFFQVAPRLSSQVLSGHRSRPTATQKI